MDNVQTKAVGLGLVFGVVFGAVLGPLIFDDPSFGIGLGISLGLVYGAAFCHYQKGQQDTDAPNDDGGDHSAE